MDSSGNQLFVPERSLCLVLCSDINQLQCVFGAFTKSHQLSPVVIHWTVYLKCFTALVHPQLCCEILSVVCVILSL